MQYKLGQKLFLLKYFFIWKININSFYSNNKRNSKKSLGQYIDNVSIYNLRNIDRNIDVDNRH